MEGKRKLIHVSMIGFALLLPWLSFWQAAALGVVALAFNLFVMPRVGRSMYREADVKRGLPVGMIAYCISVLVLLFLYPFNIVAAAWAVMSFGDGFAAVVGKASPLARLSWNREKSWGGLFAFVAFGLCGALALDWWVEREAFELARIGPVFLVCIILTAFLESAPSKLDDNFIAPLTFGTAAHLVLQTGPFALNWLLIGIALACNILLVAVISRKDALDRWGLISAFVVGMITFSFAGGHGFLMLLLFFILGTAATKFKGKKKEEAGLADAEGKKGGRRGARNVWANAAVGTGCALLAGTRPGQAELFMVALAGSYAAATADTISSELGKIYGRAPRMITTFKPAPAGVDGAVTVAGTLLGAAAALILAGLAAFFNVIPSMAVAVVVFAGVVGNSVDSYLGAILERRDLIDNEWVNFFCTLTGAVVAFYGAQQLLLL